jgi:hypothetical protein
MSKHKSVKNTTFTRREALKLLGVGAAAALSPGLQVPPPAIDSKTQTVDVVVVGAEWPE